MIFQPVIFGFDDPLWDKIGEVVREGLGVDPDPTLRERIEKLVAFHIRLRHLPELRTRRDDSEKRLARIAARRAWQLRRYGGTTEGLHAAEANEAERKRRLDAWIAAFPAPSSYRPDTPVARDLFWSDLLVIWRDIGGRDTGVDAADFLQAVSKASRSRVHRSIPEPKSTIEWLRIRARRSAPR